MTEEKQKTNNPGDAASSPSPKYPWYLRGVVVHGHGRGGSKLGYPTANVQLDAATVQSLMDYNNLVLFGYGCIEGTTPNEGVAVEESQQLGPFPFAMSVGYNPQFQDVALSAEVHFLETFAQDFYDSCIRIVVIGSIRPMYAFQSLDELISTINKDVAKTQEKLMLPEVSAFEKDPFIQPRNRLPPSVLSALPYFKVGKGACEQK